MTLHEHDHHSHEHSEEEEEIAKVLSSHVQWPDGKAPDAGTEQKADTDEVQASQGTDSAELETSEATQVESIFAF